jgi:hypothetical protein
MLLTFFVDSDHLLVFTHIIRHSNGAKQLLIALSLPVFCLIIDSWFEAAYN